MKAQEIRELSIDEINSKLVDARQELMNLRFQMVTGQLTDISRFKVTRHLIARFETILRDRDLEVEESEA